MNPPRSRDFYSPPRPGTRALTGALLALLGPIILFTGCMSPKYKAAPKTTLPPVLFNLPSTEPPFEVLLHTVIIYRSPGSWKRDAYWDEYVVTVANRGGALITVDSAWLMDFRGESVEYGTKPWMLEALSLNIVGKSMSLARNSAVQLGGGIGVLAIGGGVGAAVFTGAAYVGSAGGAAIGGIILLPAVIGTTIYGNISNRQSIEREFERRRLVMPLELLPGQLVQGSIFFPITPGPRWLILKCRVNDGPRTVIVDLTPMAGLHLKSPPPTTTPLILPTGG